jgi:ATP adenylyltransferase
MWSPWRSAHIERITQDTEADEQEGPSLFARLAAEDNDEENLILWRGEHVFVIMNRYPYNNGHLMVVPFREVAAYEALTTDEQIALARALAHAIRWLKQALNPEGFNVGMNLGAAAGAGIPRHLHMHIVPRWSGDTNFMPTIGEVKVIPEALHVTYAKLRAAIETIAENPANM